MERKKGNPSLRSVTRIRDPRYPGVLLRVTELKRDGPLFAARQVNGKPRYQKIAPEVTWISLGKTEKERKQKAEARGLDLIEDPRILHGVSANGRSRTMWRYGEALSVLPVHKLEELTKAVSVHFVLEI